MTRLVLFCVGLGGAFVAVAIAVAAFGTPALYALLGLGVIVAILRKAWQVASFSDKQEDQLDFHASDAQRKKLAAIANLRADYAARDAYNQKLLRENAGRGGWTPGETR